MECARWAPAVLVCPLDSRYGRGSDERFVTLQEEGEFSSRKPDRDVRGEVPQDVQSLRGGYFAVTMQLVDEPEDTVDLDRGPCRERAQRFISGQQNAAFMRLGEDERECVMHREPWLLPNHLLSSRDAFSWQVHYLEPSSDEGRLLSGGKPDQFLIESYSE